MFTYGVTPSEVHVRLGKEKALMELAAGTLDSGLSHRWCDN